MKKTWFVAIITLISAGIFTGSFFVGQALANSYNALAVTNTNTVSRPEANNLIPSKPEADTSKEVPSKLNNDVPELKGWPEELPKLEENSQAASQVFYNAKNRSLNRWH